MSLNMDRYIYYINRAGLEYKQYQYEGVNWCLNNELCIDPLYNIRGGFIADEMGLGKTITIIGLMYTNIVYYTLIIVPPLLIDQWFQQIYKTTGHKPLIYHGNNKKKITLEQLNLSHIVITTYGAITLSKKNIKEGIVTMIHKINWDRIVFDEAHHLRNRNTTCYISARILSAKIRWLVSGTPIQNNKKDFYTLCSIIRLPASFYTDITKIRSQLHLFFIKRTKQEIGINIPNIEYKKTVVNWSNQKEMLLSKELHSVLSFSKAKSNNNLLIDSLFNKGTISIILRARQSCIYPLLMLKPLNSLLGVISKNEYASYQEAITNSSKIDTVIKEIIKHKNNNCGKLVFCHFQAEIDEIATRLRNEGIDKVVTLDGRTCKKQRKFILNEKNNILIIQIQTGCEGINLQENYSEIYFVSPHWNPSVEDQAISRCHRIGQTKIVQVHRFEMSSFETNNDKDNNDKNNKDDEDDKDDKDDKVETKTIDKYIEDVHKCKRYIVSEIIS